MSFDNTCERRKLKSARFLRNYLGSKSAPSGIVHDRKTSMC